MAAAKKTIKEKISANKKKANAKPKAVVKTFKKKALKSPPVAIKKTKRTPKPEAYKNRHNIGRRAAGRVHSYKETEYAVSFPDGYWEDLIKSETNKLAAKEENDGEGGKSKQEEVSSNRKRRSTETASEEPVKKTKKKEEPKKSPKKVEKKVKAKEVESEPEEEEEEEDEEEEEVVVPKPRKPRFADIKPRAPRIKRTACLNAKAIVSLMYEKEEPLKKAKVDVSEDEEEEATDSESLDWEVSFPKWKPKGRSSSPPSDQAQKVKKKAEKKDKKTDNGVEFSPWSPPRRMASLNAQAILSACMDERTKKPKAETAAKESHKETTEVPKPKKKEEASKKTMKGAAIKTEMSLSPASPSTSSGASNKATDSRKFSKPNCSSNKSPEVQIVEVKKSPSSTPLPPSQTFRPSYIPRQSSILPPGQLYPHEYMRYTHGAPSHARSLGTQTSFPLPPTSQRHYSQHMYAYPGGSHSPYPPQPQYNRDLWSPHYGRGERLPFANQYKDGRLPLRYPTPPPPQSPFHQQPQQPYPYPTASNVYLPPSQHYQAFPMEQQPAQPQQQQQPVPPGPPKAPARMPSQRHCLAPPMPQPPHHHHHHQSPPKPFQSPTNSFSSSSSTSSSLPSSSSSSKASDNKSKPPSKNTGSPQKDDTKILYNSGGSKFHTQPVAKGCPNGTIPLLPISSSTPSSSTTQETLQANTPSHPPVPQEKPKTSCSAPNTSAMVMTVCATGTKNTNGGPVGGCSYTSATLQNNQNPSCQPFMLSTISAEGAFPIVPFQQYGTSAFAVPSFEDQQRLTFGYYQPAGPLIQTMPGESVFLQHPMGLQSLHHPQVKVLVHNTGFVPSGVCQAAEIVADSEVVKPVTLAIPLDKSVVKTDLSPVKNSESQPHLVAIAPKRAAPVAIAPRPAAMVTNVTTVLTQPQPTTAVQVAMPQNKKPSGKTAKASSTASQPKTDPPPPPPVSSTSTSSSSSSSSQTTASSSTSSSTASSTASSTSSLPSTTPNNCNTARSSASSKRKSTNEKKETTPPKPSKKVKASSPVNPVITVTIHPAKKPLAREATTKDMSRMLPPLMVNISSEEALPLRRTSPRLSSPNSSATTLMISPGKTKPTPKRQKSLTPPPKANKPTPSPKTKKDNSRPKPPCFRTLRASSVCKSDDFPRQKKDLISPAVEGDKFYNPKRKDARKSMWEWNGDVQSSTRADSPTPGQKSYAAIRHKIDGDIIRKRDCVLVKSGPRKKDIPFVAKICSLWEKEGEMFMSVFWYYRPEHTETEKLPRCISCDVFASKHRDVIPVNCIEDKCYVLTHNEYCRYRAELKRLEDHCPPRPPLAQAENDPPEPLPHRLPSSGVDPESVFLCRKVYDVKLKRVLKNPQVHSSP